MMCFQAMGKVKPQQLVDFAFFCFSALIVLVVHWFSGNIEMAFSVYVGFQLVYMFVYVAIGATYFNWSLGCLIREIVIPGFFVFAAGLALVRSVEVLWISPNMRFVVNSFLLVVCVGLLSWVLILKSKERELVSAVVRRTIERVLCPFR